MKIVTSIYVPNKFMTVVFDNGETFSIRNDHYTWSDSVKLLEDQKDDELYEKITLKQRVSKSVELSFNFSIRDGILFYLDEEIHGNVADTIVKMIQDNNDVLPMLRFILRCKKNPNEKSVKMLYEFLQYEGLAFSEEGTFFAYKSVQRREENGLISYWSWTSGADGKKVENILGKETTMDRDLVTFDPESHCSGGLHLGSWKYASSFYSGNKDFELLLCEIAPENVVSVPNDAHEKVRCCEYVPVGVYSNRQPIGNVYHKSMAYRGTFEKLS